MSLKKFFPSPQNFHGTPKAPLSPSKTALKRNQGIRKTNATTPCYTIMIKDMISIYILPDNQQLQFLSNSLTLQVIHLIEYKIATDKKRKAHKKNKPAPNGNE